MPFLTELEVTLIRGKSDGGRQMWRVDAPLIYGSKVAEQTITVPKGFETDFSSVPRLPLAYLLTGDTAHEAAVVHDFLYVSKQTSKKIADDVFLEAMEESGVSWWRRKVMWAAVSAFGGKGTAQTMPEAFGP
jgi:hypothetical protein